MAAEQRRVAAERWAMSADVAAAAAAGCSRRRCLDEGNVRAREEEVEGDDDYLGAGRPWFRTGGERWCSL